MADRVDLTEAELGRRPLPDHGDATDKHERGTVLVIGGSGETAGALVLAGIAALRVGAGRIQLATVRSCASALSVAVPEARVIGLEETATGAIQPDSAALLGDDIGSASTVLLGSGTLDRDATAELVRGIVPRVGSASLVLDANGLAAVEHDPTVTHGLARAVLTPNPDEAAQLPGENARSIADATRCVVAVRGATTEIAAPGGPVFVDHSGNGGLATSGSGDVLAGALAGLCARGADPLTATLWAVAAHGRAGGRCAARIGPLGFLARELLDELPALLAGRPPVAGPD
jgi:hydroxyethylthiazole kinase-like uncharacterized protein yjeF